FFIPRIFADPNPQNFFARLPMSLDLDQVVVDAQNAFAAVQDNASLENEKARFLGKSGVLTDLLKGLGKLDPETRKSEG
ncbi:hypothetical protein Q6311_31425, partial [Klebsiella variicola]